MVNALVAIVAGLIGSVVTLLATGGVRYAAARYEIEAHDRLVNELDEDVPPGELGVLLTRGPYTPRGYYRAAEHNAISFTSGLGTPFIRDPNSANINNATSTKQNVNSTTGLVVLASDDVTGYYWHNYESLGP